MKCGKLIKKLGMPKAGPCLRKKNHGGFHTPDLSGLKIHNYVVLHRELDRVRPSKQGVWWVVLDRSGNRRIVIASSLFNGDSIGLHTRRGGSLAVHDKLGHIKPEYRTVVFHLNRWRRKIGNYGKMKFFKDWDSDQGGAPIEGFLWILKNLGPKPGPDYQLHVLKNKETSARILRSRWNCVAS